MESQLFFAILVTLQCQGKSFSDPSRRSVCKFTDEGSVDISELRAIGKKTVLAPHDAHNTFFDGLAKEAAGYIFGLEPAPTDGNSTTSAVDVTLNSKAGSDYLLESIPIALREHCGGVEAAREKAYSHIDDTFASVGPVVESVSTGNYSANRAAIEDCHVGAQNNVLGLIRLIYQAIRTCLNTTNADTLAAIQTAENGSITQRIENINADFDAVKLLGVAITYGNKHVSLIHEIEQCRIRSQSALWNAISYVNGLLEALYIKSCLNNESLMVSHLSANRYRTIVRSKNIEQIAVAIFGEIIFQARKIMLGISNDDEKVFSRYNDARAKLTVALTAEGDYFFQSIIPAISPRDSYEVENGKKSLTDQIDQIITFHLSLLERALDRTKTYNEVIAYIDDRIGHVSQISDNFIDTLVASIRNGQVWSDEVEAKIWARVEKLYSIRRTYYEYVQKATEILAQIAHTNGIVHPDDISAIGVIESEVISLLHDYVDVTSDACIYAVLVSE